MKIKNQFYLLIAGIVLMPLLFFPANSMIEKLRRGHTEEAVPVYQNIDPLLNDRLNAPEREFLSRVASRLSSNMDIAVFRENMETIYSTIDGFTPGITPPESLIFSLLQSQDAEIHYIFESTPRRREFDRGQRFFVLRRIDRNGEGPPRPPSRGMILTWTFLGVIGTVVVFAVIMSLLIARSITKSILVLEKATRRIARGELDFSLSGDSALSKSTNEISSLTKSLESMRLALKENAERRNRFIMGVTHDLKTPLSLIKGYAEAIADDSEGDEAFRNQSVEIISAKTDQLEGMIDELLDFVRLDSGEWRRNLVPVKLSAFLAAFARRLENDAELLNRRLESDIRLSPEIVVPLDERLAQRALENLVNNAIRYTGSGGSITVSAYERPASGQGNKKTVEQPELVIEIRDNGSGIAAEDLPHIFEMFYRGTNSRREEGMGMGLAVVKSVVDFHGWTITASSNRKGASPEEEAGTCFRITIPEYSGGNLRGNPGSA